MRRSERHGPRDERRRRERAAAWANVRATSAVHHPGSRWMGGGGNGGGGNGGGTGGGTASSSSSSSFSCKVDDVGIDLDASFELSLGGGDGGGGDGSGGAGGAGGVGEGMFFFQASPAYGVGVERVEMGDDAWPTEQHFDCLSRGASYSSYLLGNPLGEDSWGGGEDSWGGGGEGKK